ncbi:MAG: PEGA domain-containing protein [bacterium]
MAFNLAHRRLLAASFVVAFLVSGPLVILYASGYRYEIKNGKVTKTAALELISDPKDVIVLVDGKQVKDSTPWYDYSLSGGTYEVELKKEGYFPWKKKISILPGTAKRFNKIVLLKDPKQSPDLMAITATVKKESEPQKEITIKSYPGYKHFDGQGNEKYQLYISANKNCLLLSASDGNNQQFCWPEMIRKAIWSDKGLLLVMSDHRAGTYDPSAQSLSAVWRSGDLLIDGVWLPDSPYVLLLTKEALLAVETQDPLGQPMIYRLLDNDGLYASLSIHDNKQITLTNKNKDLIIKIR